jgi:hypothetical protein
MRQPLLIVSPFSKPNVVDGALTTQASIVQSSGTNWLYGQREDLRTVALGVGPSRPGSELVDADLLGHAHHGAPEGRTSAQVPVYNVSMPLLKRRFPDRLPFRVLELEREESPSTNGHVPRGEAITDRIGAAATA